MHFYKYQGTGNDFIMVNDLDRSFPATDIQLIEHLCNRRFGIGADGLILLQRNTEGMFYMQYFNSDGRESSMCGNGGRCFARFIFDQGLARQSVSFMAIDGFHQATEMEDGGIALQMKDVDSVNTLDEGTFELNTGSPHYVHFTDTPVNNLELVPMAREVRYNEPYTVAGINVNYVNSLDLKSVTVRTYERGVEDETLSCGTGATAAAISCAIFHGLPEGVHTLNVQVAGGKLKVKFKKEISTGKYTDVWLMGPAQFVYDGRISI